VFIAKGLLYWYWGIVLGEGDSVLAVLMTDAAADVFDGLFLGLRSRARVNEVLTRFIREGAERGV